MSAEMKPLLPEEPSLLQDRRPARSFREPLPLIVTLFVLSLIAAIWIFSSSLPEALRYNESIAAENRWIEYHNVTSPFDRLPLRPMRELDSLIAAGALSSFMTILTAGILYKHCQARREHEGHTYYPVELR